MSNMMFTIDAVPTPVIDLAGAFSKDLEYYNKNGRMPPLGRSALTEAETKLNNYLRYVNENFIQEGFSASSPDVSTATDTPVIRWSNNGVATITGTLATTMGITLSPKAKADIFLDWVVNGNHTPKSVPGSDPNVPPTLVNGTLTAELWVNGVKGKVWTHKLSAGDNLIAVPVCLTAGKEGDYTIQLKMKVSDGTLRIPAESHYAFAQARIVR